MKRKALIAAGLGLLMCLTAHAQVQAQQDWRALILTALQSPTGSVDTVLTGPFADQAKKGLKTSEDIRVRVSTVAVLPQPGCKRMEVLMYIPDKKFPTTDGGEHEFRTGFQLNVCPDGRPPESSDAK